MTLGRPDRPVVAILGDGGLMFGVQALWTAVQHRVPVLFVVCDNGGWHSMRTSLTRLSPQLAATGTELGFAWEADYAGLARSLGMRASVVSSPAELQGVLADGGLLDEPLLLHVRCRRERRVSGWLASGLS